MEFIVQNGPSGGYKEAYHLRPLTTETPCEGKILWLTEKKNHGKKSAGCLNVENDSHSNTLGVNGSQVGIFKQRDEVCLSCFLKSHHSGRLEAQIRL